DSRNDRSSTLTAGTVKRAALSYHFAPNWLAAAGAGPAFATVDFQRLGEVAGRTVAHGEIAQRRAADFNGVGKDPPDNRSQPVIAYPADSPGRPARVDAGGEQCLGSIDIAHADHGFCIHDEGLDRNTPAAAALPQPFAAERGAQRFRAQAGQARVRVGLVAAPQQRAKAARIGKADQVAALDQIG